MNQISECSLGREIKDMGKDGEYLGSRVFRVMFLLGFLLAGCFEPNAGLNFASKREKDVETPSVIELTQNHQELDLKTKESLQRYGGTIQGYAYKYQVDWRLVLAVMKQESQFRAKAVSYRGAYGLMQIMPLTEAELTQKIGVRNTRSPYNNIKAGIFHLKTLYRFFENARGDERVRLTLAAYNAGLSRIQDAQDVAEYLGDDPNAWKGVRDALQLLSRRYKTFHRNIWNDGTPRAGYFKDWRQTTNYVESIMSYYDEYQLALR